MNLFNIDFGSKRSKSAIRFLTYGFSTVFVVGFTVALVLATLGYDIDRNTGEVIQNGLVLVNSEPSGATVTIDGQDERDDTPGRFSLPEGEHTIKVNRPGYQEWTKSVQVSGSEVVWLYYPLLIPTDTTASAVTTAKNIEFISQVPDGQRMLIRSQQNNARFRLSTISKTAVTNDENIVVPNNVFTLRDDKFGAMRFGGWASGDDYFLVQHRNGNVFEFVLVDVNNPEESINLTNQFSFPLRAVRFVKDNHERMYALVNGDLRSLNLGDRTISAPIVEDVSRYVLHTDRFVVFVRSTEDGAAELGLIDGDNEPTMVQSLPRNANQYRIEFAEFDDQFHLALLDIGSGDLTIRFNPHQDNTLSPIQIRQSGSNFLSFSRNGRFVMTQSGTSFAVYDFDEEVEYSFKTTIDIPTDVEAKWLDGHHIVLNDRDGRVSLTEFDGQNTYEIGTTDVNFDVFLNEGQRMIYMLAEPTTAGVSIINGLDLDTEI